MVPNTLLDLIRTFLYVVSFLLFARMGLRHGSWDYRTANLAQLTHDSDLSGVCTHVRASTVQRSKIDQWHFSPDLSISRVTRSWPVLTPAFWYRRLVGKETNQRCNLRDRWPSMSYPTIENVFTLTKGLTFCSLLRISWIEHSYLRQMRGRGLGRCNIVKPIGVIRPAFGPSSGLPRSRTVYS